MNTLPLEMFRFFVILSCLGSLCGVSAVKLVIDHDGGADDAMALFLAILYEEHFSGPTIVGVTTSHGNVDEEQTFNNTQRILDIANCTHIPIFRGSNSSLVTTEETDYFFGNDGLGDLPNVTFEPIPAQPQHAALALIELSKKYEGDLVVLTLGPLTNIALAIRLDPLFISRLSQLYVAAGKIFDKSSPNPPFNIKIDVEAYYVVLQNAVPEKVTLIYHNLLKPGLQANRNISMEWRQNVLGKINSTIMQAQNEIEGISEAGTYTWSLLDPLAMAMVLKDNLIESRVCDNSTVYLCGEQRGMNTDDFSECSTSNAKLAYPAPVEDFKSFLYNVFSSQLRHN